MQNSPTDDLSDLLKRWEPAPIHAARIKSGVWSRIEIRSRNRFALVMIRIASWGDHPAVAAAAVIVAIAVGITFGSTAATQAQAEAYLQSMVAFRH